MKTINDLAYTLKSLDKQSYGGYKRLKGRYQYNQFQLAVDHIQSDPFAPPSKMRMIMDREATGIPYEYTDSKDKITAVSDFLTRVFHKNVQSIHTSSKGTGKSGLITIDRCGQEILERTSVVINADTVEVRIEIGLPAAGRKILGHAALSIFKDVLPAVVTRTLLYRNMDQEALKKQITLMIDQVHIRNILKEKHFTAFVADGSILPRESGVSDTPLKHAVPFISPKHFETVINLPSGKTITGMGIPEGITLIVGGGYHGKSTLLHALERGVYHHVPGDGREFVITRDDAVKIRAEDGRNVEKVNISPFINNLPGKKDTQKFSTENASGSTSQSANVVEAVEAESSLLLIDEDTSATNFMIRDQRMQKLIAPDKEPITPFTQKIKPLYNDLGISTILIVGGSGDYFEAADQVLMMDEYQLKDVTETAKSIAETDGDRRERNADRIFGELSPRIALKSGFTLKGKHRKVKTKGITTILYGSESINLSSVEQLVDDSQTQSIALMIEFMQRNVLNDEITLKEAVEQLYNHIEVHGLDSISPHDGHPGNLALPRKQEVFAAVNRYRGLKIK